MQSLNWKTEGKRESAVIGKCYNLLRFEIRPNEKETNDSLLYWNNQVLPRKTVFTIGWCYPTMKEDTTIVWDEEDAEEVYTGTREKCKMWAAENWKRLLAETEGEPLEPAEIRGAFNILSVG